MPGEIPVDFFKTHKQAIIGTVRKDGRPHLTSVLAVYDDGKFVISITESRAKYRNLQRDPRASLMILGDNFFQYAVVEGRGSFIHLPDAQSRLRDYYEKASGQAHPDWDEYDRAMRAERRVILEVSIDRVSTFNVG